jgi:hypothetical protein
MGLRGTQLTGSIIYTLVTHKLHMIKMPPAQVNLIQKNIYGDHKTMLTPIPLYLDIFRNFPRICKGQLAS